MYYSRPLISIAGALALLAAAPPSPVLTLTDPPRRGAKPRWQPAPRGLVRLNRSRKWDYAATYAEARAMSPSPDRPVR